MMTPEAIKEMEEFRAANREYISREWHLEENRSNSVDSPRHVYSRRLNHRPPKYEASCKSIEPVRHVQRPTTSSSSSRTSWFEDPELKRQKRVVKYKSYAVEGKMKASLRNGFRWIKNKYSTFVHGY